MPTKDTNDEKKNFKWFLHTQTGSYDVGVYDQEEIENMPKSAKANLQTLSSAITEKKIVADLSSAEHLVDVNLYSPIDKKTNEPVKMKGVKSGKTPEDLGVVKVESNKGKIENALRDKILEAKERSEEDSIKAKIAAMKAGKK